MSGGLLRSCCHPHHRRGYSEADGEAKRGVGRALLEMLQAPGRSKMQRQRRQLGQRAVGEHTPQGKGSRPEACQSWCCETHLWWLKASRGGADATRWEAGGVALQYALRKKGKGDGPSATQLTRTARVDLWQRDSTEVRLISPEAGRRDLVQTFGWRIGGEVKTREVEDGSRLKTEEGSTGNTGPGHPDGEETGAKLASPSPGGAGGREDGGAGDGGSRGRDGYDGSHDGEAWVETLKRSGDQRWLDLTGTGGARNSFAARLGGGWLSSSRRPPPVVRSSLPPGRSPRTIRQGGHSHATPEELPRHHHR